MLPPRTPKPRWLCLNRMMLLPLCPLLFILPLWRMLRQRMQHFKCFKT